MIPCSVVSVNMIKQRPDYSWANAKKKNGETVKMHFVIVAPICCSNKVVTQTLSIQFMNPFTPT